MTQNVKYMQLVCAGLDGGGLRIVKVVGNTTREINSSLLSVAKVIITVDGQHYKLAVTRNGDVSVDTSDSFSKLAPPSTLSTSPIQVVTGAYGEKQLSLGGRVLPVATLLLLAFVCTPKDYDYYINNDREYEPYYIDGIRSNLCLNNLDWQLKEASADQLNYIGKSTFSETALDDVRGRGFFDVTRKMTFDTGHRVPAHASKCRNVHGHTWTIEATFSGLIKPVTNHSSDGMVIDYGDIKKFITQAVHEPWDHGFIVWADDTEMLNALNTLPNNKTIVVNMPPTSEYLAYLAFYEINKHVLPTYGFSPEFFLKEVKLHETPNCSAVYTATCAAQVKSL